MKFFWKDIEGSNLCWGVKQQRTEQEAAFMYGSLGSGVELPRMTWDWWDLCGLIFDFFFSSVGQSLASCFLRDWKQPLG